MSWVAIFILTCVLISCSSWRLTGNATNLHFSIAFVGVTLLQVTAVIGIAVIALAEGGFLPW